MGDRKARWSEISYLHGAANKRWAFQTKFMYITDTASQRGSK